MVKCGKCQQEGHNIRTCKTTVAVAVAVAEPAKTVVIKLKKKMTPPPTPPPEPETKTIWPPLPTEIWPPLPVETESEGSVCSSVSSIEPPQKSFSERASDSVLDFIFKKISPATDTMEWFLLRDYYLAHPENFKVVLSPHWSRGDNEQHITLHVRYVYNGSITPFIKNAYYHLYGIPFFDPVRQKSRTTYTRVTGESIDKIHYTIADFRRVRKF